MERIHQLEGDREELLLDLDEIEQGRCSPKHWRPRYRTTSKRPKVSAMDIRTCPGGEKWLRHGARGSLRRRNGGSPGTEGQRPKGG